jgi:hypothetical protein
MRCVPDRKQLQLQFRRSLKQTGETVKGSLVFSRRLHQSWPLPSTPSSAHPLIARRQFEWIVEPHLSPAEPPSRSHSLCGFAAGTTSLDPRVRPITEGRIFRLLTATEYHPFLLFKVNLHRRELHPRMGSIAKRLRFRSPALTPIDSAWNYFDNAGRPLRNHRLIRHQIFLHAFMRRKG